MMADEYYDRIDHYLSAFNLKTEKRRLIRERIYRANLTPDDPMAMQIAQDGITEGRIATIMAALGKFPEQMEQSAKMLATNISEQVATDIDMRNAHFLSALWEQVGKEVDLAIRQEVARADVRFFRRAALQIAIVCLLGASMTGFLGYRLGRQELQDIEREHAAFVARPDARTWLEIVDRNPDLDTTLREYCRNNGSQRFLAEGREACAIPLWID